MSQYKRLSVPFPADEYMYLKMACVKQNVSIKEFVTKAVMKSIHEYEDYLDTLAVDSVTEEDLKNAISLDQLKAELGLNEKEISGLSSDI